MSGQVLGPWVGGGDSNGVVQGTKESGPKATS